jgi:Ca2+/Na+ antiporter
MKLRIAIWASAGFLVAVFWSLFAIVTFPSTSERMRDAWILTSLTCPVSIAGMHYPISLYEVLAANAVTYALVGLIVETLRHPTASREINYRQKHFLK